MTQEERMAKAAKLYKELQGMMTALYCRWKDESEYENIEDYSVNLKKEVEKIGGTFIKMSKRPFGFTYRLSDATYQMSVASTKYKYQRIG